MENRSALSIVQQSPEISATLNLLRTGEKALQWEGLVGSSLAFYAAAIADVKGG